MNNIEKKFIELVQAELPAVQPEVVQRVLQHLLAVDLVTQKKVRDFFIIRTYPQEMAKHGQKVQAVAALGNATGLSDSTVYRVLSNSCRLFVHKKRGSKDPLTDK